jgi:hypothetical protein
MTAFIIRRTSPFSAASISAGFTCVSFTPFFISYYFEYDYEDDLTNLTYLNAWEYDDIVLQVAGAHAVLIGVTLLAILGLERPQRAWKPRRSVIATMLSRIRSATSAVPAPSSLWLTYGVLWLLVLEFGHFLSIDKKLLWENNYYLTITDPYAMGIRIPIFEMMHLLLGPMCAAAICLCYYAWHRRQMLLFALSMMSLAYTGLLVLAVFSRWSALSAVLFTTLLAGGRFSRGKSIISPATTIMALVSVWLYLYAFKARGGPTHGIVGILPNLFSWRDAKFDVPGTVVNIGLGPYVMAEALKRGTCVYDPSYMNLSFSLLPSVLDGWRSVIDLQYLINW